MKTIDFSQLEKLVDAAGTRVLNEEEQTILHEQCTHLQEVLQEYDGLIPSVPIDAVDAYVDAHAARLALIQQHFDGAIPETEKKTYRQLNLHTIEVMQRISNNLIHSIMFDAGMEILPDDSEKEMVRLVREHYTPEKLHDMIFRQYQRSLGFVDENVFHVLADLQTSAIARQTNLWKEEQPQEELDELLCNVEKALHRNFETHLRYDPDQSKFEDMLLFLYSQYQGVLSTAMIPSGLTAGEAMELSSSYLTTLGTQAGAMLHFYVALQSRRQYHEGMENQKEIEQLYKENLGKFLGYLGTHLEETLRVGVDTVLEAAHQAEDLSQGKPDFAFKMNPKKFMEWYESFSLNKQHEIIAHIKQTTAYKQAMVYKQEISQALQAAEPFANYPVLAEKEFNANLTELLMDARPEPKELIGPVFLEQYPFLHLLKTEQGRELFGLQELVPETTHVDYEQIASDLRSVPEPGLFGRMLKNPYKKVRHSNEAIRSILYEPHTAQQFYNQMHELGKIAPRTKEDQLINRRKQLIQGLVEVFGIPEDTDYQDLSKALSKTAHPYAMFWIDFGNAVMHPDAFSEPGLRYNEPGGIKDLVTEVFKYMPQDL